MEPLDVPLVDLRSQYIEIQEEVEKDLRRTLAEGAYVGGPDVRLFEDEYADFCDARNCIGVANGTDALELALRAVGVVAGDEVVLPANTFIATAEAVTRIGAIPVLVDVRPDTLLIDLDQVLEVVGARTKAVVPVHLFGQMVPMGELVTALADTGIRVVEDAAQSQGATYDGRQAAALSSAAATSFYPGKNLGAAGDAGAVTTNDDDVAKKVRLLSNHGSATKYVHEVVGFNSRLDTIQAIVLRHKLRRLRAWNDRRRALAHRYSRMLETRDDVLTPAVDPRGEPVWHLYVIQVDQRDEVLRRLQEEGIRAGIHYPQPIHLTPAFSWLRHKGNFPEAERAAARMISLPMHPHLTDAQQEHVVGVLCRVLDELQ